MVAVTMRPASDETWRRRATKNCRNWRRGRLPGSLDAVSDIVRRTDIASAVVTMVEPLESPSVVRGTPSKGRRGRGDSRLPGPPGDGPTGVIPRWERWEIQYESSSVDAYAKQLDFFKIEIGAAGGKKEMDYAFNFSKTRPDTRIGPGDKETRFYVTWRSGTLRQYDRALLAKANIPTQGRQVMQFFPLELEDALVSMEQQNAKGRRSQEYLKTVFKVRSTSSGFEFFIVEQRFRPAPPGV